MAMPAHMEVTGNNQGKIDGSCDMKGRENTILVYAMEHMIHIPRDVHTGLPTGKRAHSPLTITKEFDKASPKLYQALCTGEQLSPVTIKYFRIDPAGKEEHYYTIELDTAIIVQIEPYFPITFERQSEPYKHMEKVSLTYEKIIWRWEPDGVESEDSWKVPV